MNIWEGIYKNFDEARRVGPGFSSDIWLKKSAQKISQTLKIAQQKKIIPEFVAYNNSLLPIVSAVLYAKKGAVKILDFGGNFGFEFLRVAKSLNPAPQKIEYHILDNKEVCMAAAKLFRTDKRIRFHHTMPKNMRGVDVVHLGSSLQYVENWEQCLQELVNLKPTYLLFTDLVAGTIPMYASVQNYYDSKIPVWFFNLEDIIKKLDKSGYKLIFKSRFQGTFLDKEQDNPQPNFPEKFRLKNPCSLLFVKK